MVKEGGPCRNWLIYGYPKQCAAVRPKDLSKQQAVGPATLMATRSKGSDRLREVMSRPGNEASYTNTKLETHANQPGSTTRQPASKVRPHVNQELRLVIGGGELSY